MNSKEGYAGQALPTERDRPVERRIIMITPRDREILTRQAQGETTAETANAVFASESKTKSTYLRSLYDKFGTSSTTETVKQAVILGAVTDVPSITAAQMTLVTGEQQDILQAAYKLNLKKNQTQQIADALRRDYSTVRQQLTQIYSALGIPNLKSAVAMYARTVYVPEKRDAIVCIQEEDGPVTEKDLRWLEGFEAEEKIDSRRPDNIKQMLHALRNGGTIDLTKHASMVDILTVPTQLRITETGLEPKFVVWPLVQRAQRGHVSSLFIPAKPLREL